MDQLAGELHFSYRVLTADLDERALGAGAATPSQLVMLLAKAKGAALQSRLEAAAQPGGPDGAGTATQSLSAGAAQLGGPDGAGSGLRTPHGGPGLPAPCSSEAVRAYAPEGVTNSDQTTARPAAQQATSREPDAAEGAETACLVTKHPLDLASEGIAAAEELSTCCSRDSKLGAAGLGCFAPYSPHAHGHFLLAKAWPRALVSRRNGAGQGTMSG